MADKFSNLKKGKRLTDTAANLALGADNDWSWIEICREIDAPHEGQGQVDITEKTIDNMIGHFKKGVRGLFENDLSGNPDFTKPILDIDYDHKEDPAKGNKAAGWIKDLKKEYVQLKDGRKVASLWAKPGHWSSDAQAAIQNKEYKFTSVEYDDWTDPETNKTYKDVLFGTALTNRPFVKEQAAVTLSETTTKEAKKPMLKKLKEMFGITGAVKLAEDATDDVIVEATISHIKTLTEAKNVSDTKLAEATKKLGEFDTRHEKFMLAKITKLSEGRVSPADREKGVYKKFLSEKRYDELADFLKLIPKKLKENGKGLSEAEPDGEKVYASEAEKLNAQIFDHMKQKQMSVDKAGKDFHKNYMAAHDEVQKMNAEAAMKAEAEKYAEAEAAKKNPPAKPADSAPAPDPEDEEEEE